MALDLDVHLASITFALPDSFLMSSGGEFCKSAAELAVKNEAPQRGEELLSPRLWSLPDVFRRRLTAFSNSVMSETTRQNRIASIVHYNFSNGVSITSQDILRHQYQKLISLELLPAQSALDSSRASDLNLEKWPLLQQEGSTFISQDLYDLEKIMQDLISRVLLYCEQKKIPLYIQLDEVTKRAVLIDRVSYLRDSALVWRLHTDSFGDFSSELKLISEMNEDLYVYSSFAIAVNREKQHRLIVHSWLNEFTLLGQQVRKLQQLVFKNLALAFESENDLRKILNALRLRPIKVFVEGGRFQVEGKNVLTEINISQSGNYSLIHSARVANQKDLRGHGYTYQFNQVLLAIREGIAAWFAIDSKELASKNRGKREWDLRLLKHFGIIQYVIFEALTYHFENSLSSGLTIERESLFSALEPKIQALLTSGTSGVLVKETPLRELCSKSVVSCMSEFVDALLNAIQQSQSYFSEFGEVVVESVVEREFLFLYTILKRLALETGGDIFKKAKSAQILEVLGDEKKNQPDLRSAIEMVQELIPFGFKIFFEGRAVEELDENDFETDFSIQSGISTGDARAINWFELNPKFFFRGKEISGDDFLSLGSGGVIEYEGQFYLIPKKQIPSLRRLEKFWVRLQEGKKESKKNTLSERVFQLPKNQTLELLSLRNSGVKVRGDAEWNELCRFYDNLEKHNSSWSVENFQLPKKMNAELKPYQIFGVKWLQDLYKLRLGALLADDMGLGKTVQTLVFLQDLYEKKQMGQVLIVVPSSLVYNWQTEAEKFTPNIPVHIFSSREVSRTQEIFQDKEDHLVITTYGLLLEHQEMFREHVWKVVIFDEAQNLKNITTKRTSAARALNAQFKICLTGTPMENHYGEFYSLVDILVPGSLGPIEDFRRRFVHAETVSRNEIEDLKLKIRPLLLRRSKKEIIDQLPEKQETKISIAFDDQQREIYRDIALSYNDRVQEALSQNQQAGTGEANVQLQMLTALLRLRQCCSDPAGLPNIQYKKTPPKIEALVDSIVEIVESGESALVFTQFLQTLHHAEKILKENKIPVYILHGGVPLVQRQRTLAAFNAEPGGAVLVMTLKTGGVGLNLTKASYVFHLEPWWNPAVENQATDRVHRLGQTRAVQVFRYIMHESLEEKIELLKNRKDLRFQALLASAENDNDLKNGGTALTKQDFDLLLGLDS